MRNRLGVRVLALAALALCGPAARAQPAAEAAGVLPRAARAADTTVLTLLGTQGGPGVTVRRAGEANLLTVRGKNYVIDAGVGVERRLAEAGVPLANVSKVFITHHHNDHTAGLFGMITLYSSRQNQLEIIGPPPTEAFVKGALALARINWDVRAEQGGLTTAQMLAMFKARDVQPGPVYQDDNVKVTAFENEHFHLKGTPVAADKSYAYRFQTPHKTIVFTGDTGQQAALAKFAEGADILVCEMVSPSILTGILGGNFHMVHEHLSPTQVGQLARDAKVKMVVLSHIVGGTDADLAEIRKWYAGTVVLGEDLQVYKEAPAPIRSRRPEGRRGAADAGTQIVWS
jgi:ribonuclease BN (tRNA processing enzyme)